MEPTKLSLNLKGLVHDRTGSSDELRELIRLQENSYVFHEGEIPRGLFFVRTGAVKLVINRPILRGRTNTSEYLLKIVGPGEFFGYRALVAKEKHNYFAKTIRPSEISIFSPASILNVLSGPNTLVKGLMSQLVADVEYFEATAQNQYLASVQERIAFLLLGLADKFGVQQGRGISIGLRLTRNEMAQMASTINESLSRHLTDFKNEGLIDLVGKDIVILDRAGLVERAGSKVQEPLEEMPPLKSKSTIGHEVHV